MFLKSLTLKGFKSFAEATSLDLEPGVTVIVGPNGSGKSNVVDAIAWVLGAQAPSSVRSQKMDDVIFAGTAKRSALGRAEVTLTIDNTAGIIPVAMAEVTVTRVLFRNGDSEYAINGTPCRLLDVQELLSDAGVGRQQHVIVSQGQIDAVLNSRPEERRQILEEAAGVLKYRKRKEKAERRLAATETDLNRLQDLLREVRRGLRPLQRQADAAARHGGLVAELHELRLHQAGRELVVLRDQARTIAGERAEAARLSNMARAELAGLDAAVLATEARLSAHGGDDLGDTLVRYESLRERARGQLAVLTERQRGIERERERFTARDVIANLEGEAARLQQELRAVSAASEELLVEAERVVVAEAGLEQARQDFETRWSSGVPTSDGRAAEIRGELGALSASIERGEAERSRVQRRLVDLSERAAAADGDVSTKAGALAEIEAALAPLVSRLDQLDAGSADLAARFEAAGAVAADAEATWRAWDARVEALELALDQARARAGTERLADVEGVLGTLLDLVDVDSGWEAAFAAAAGEALSAVVVRDVDAGRAALISLAAGEVAGAVLALGGSGIVHASGPLPGQPVRAHVRPLEPRVGPLLDAVLGGAVAVDGDVMAALDVALAHPGLVVVTLKGDRLGPTGWRVGAAATEATGAALVEAYAHLAEATMRRDAARAVEAQRRQERGAFTLERADLGRRVNDLERRRDQARAASGRAESLRRDAATEVEALRPQLNELEGRLGPERARRDALAAELPALEEAEAQIQVATRALAGDRRGLEERQHAVATLRNDLEVRAAALEERRGVLRQRQMHIDEQLARFEVERREAAGLREQLDARAEATGALEQLVTARLELVERELVELREVRRRQSEEARAVGAELDALRRQRAAAEKQLEAGRERATRAELNETEVRLRMETAVDAVRRELDREPQQAIETPCPELPAGMNVLARIRELDRELKVMGPINPLALEEFEALQERHEFLQGQMDDVHKARRELRKVIAAIDAEIVNVFAAAYTDVAANFEALFESLFPGGVGRLRLTDPDNLLDTGVEVEAKPSGKNVKKLSLLSGGERSLTALAFLFAVFRSRPSPFYVMDEVEAALDDLNLHRFLALIDEFREDAQLLIVSHQKRTMEAADCLYGVTMQPGGSSRVVSERVRAGS